MTKPELTIVAILRAAQAFHAEHGRHPTQTSGDATAHGLPGWNWSSINAALSRKSGILGGSDDVANWNDPKGSLPRLFDMFGRGLLSRDNGRRNERIKPMLPATPQPVLQVEPAKLPGPANPVIHEAVIVSDAPVLGTGDQVSRWPTRNLLKG